MNQFNASEYWEARLNTNFDLQGVGRRNWGIHYNTWAYRVRRRVFLRMMRSLGVDSGSLDILDVGTGTGFYIECWRELAVRSITGVDLTDVAVNRLTKRYPQSEFYRIDISKDIGKLRGRRFDVVSCMDVLFHIVDDSSYRRAVENIYALLRPGGFFGFTEALIRGPTSRSKHVVHRPLCNVGTMLNDVGFRVVRRKPFLVLMNDPVAAGGLLLNTYWRMLKLVVQRVRFAGAVAGAVLYPIELALVSLLKESPSTEIMLCQRPAIDAECTGRGQGMNAD